MIRRYIDSDIDSLFTPEATYRRWLQVEQAVLRAQAEVGRIVPWNECEPIFGHSPDAVRWPVLVRAIQAKERATKHDVESFVQVMADEYGDAGRRWFHFGLTSSDVVDTGLGMAIRDGGSIVAFKARTVSATLDALGDRWRTWPAVARTHGQPAALTTVGHRAMVWRSMVARALGFLQRSTNEASVGQASGPVGTWSRAVTPQVEAEAMRLLRLGPIPYATQVVPRDLHATFLFALARVTSACAKVALDLRLLTMTGEVTVPFQDGQVGSSSMPHKRNPIDCEKIAGLDRLVRGYMNAELESTALWLERDISNSSVERVAIPDALHATCHALDTLAQVLEQIEFRAPDVEAVPNSYERTIEGTLAGMDRSEARARSLE